jgi:hypothetical protein
MDLATTKNRGERIARPRWRGTRLTAARPRVQFSSVRVSGTLPQRGSLCPPRDRVRRDAPAAAGRDACAPHS